MNLFAQQPDQAAMQQQPTQNPVPQAPMPPMGPQQPQQQYQQQVPVYPSGQPGGGHPSVQLSIPAVNPPPHTPNGQFGHRSPEMIAQEVYQSQMQAGMNTPPPAVQFTPTQPGQMPTMQQQQQYQQQQQPQPPQYQQQQQPPQYQQQQQQTGGEIRGVDQNLAQHLGEEVVNEIYGMADTLQGVGEAEKANYINMAMTQVQNFPDMETYQEYTGKMGQFIQAVAKNYGEDQVDNVLDTLGKNIYEQGGDPLYQRFLRDPNMLDEEILMPYLKDKQEELGNPYEKYMQGMGNTPINRAPSMPHAQQYTAPPADPAAIDREMAAMYAPERQNERQTDAWNFRMKELADMRAMATRNF